jgi:hypothetical protein
MVAMSRFKSHIAVHQEQLAIFALPRGTQLEETENTHEGGEIGKGEQGEEGREIEEAEEAETSIAPASTSETENKATSSIPRGSEDGNVNNGTPAANNGTSPALSQQRPLLIQEYRDQWNWAADDQDYVRVGTGMRTPPTTAITRDRRG